MATAISTAVIRYHDQSRLSLLLSQMYRILIIQHRDFYLSTSTTSRVMIFFNIDYIVY